MPTAGEAVGAERVRQGMPFEREGERHRVEERHVGALAELRAGAVRGIADMDDALAPGAAERAVGIARHGHLRGVGDLVEEGRECGPEAGGIVLPSGEAARKPVLMGAGGHRPEDRGLGRGIAGQGPDGERADHPVGAAVALAEAGRRKRRVGPVHMAPDRAVGELARPDRREGGTGAERVDDQVERAEARRAGEERAAVAPGDRGAGHERDGPRHRRFVERVEQGGAVDGEAVAFAALGPIGDVEHRAAVLGLVAQHPVDPRAERPCGFARTERVEHRLAHRLDHQARAERAGLVEPVVERDVVPGLRQKRRRRQPADARAGYPDPQPVPHRGPLSGLRPHMARAAPVIAPCRGPIACL